MQALGLSLMLAGATPAAAEEGDVMIGFGGSFAGENFRGDADEFDNSRTWTAQLGYRVSDYLAFELEYENIDDFEFNESDSASDGFFTVTDEVDAKVDGFLIALNGKIFPLQSGRFRPYLMGGVGYMKAELDADLNRTVTSPTFNFSGNLDSFSQDDKAAVFQAGLGIDLQLSDNWFVELEGSYKFPTRELRDLRFYTIGGSVQFRF
jgi:opacity protein-like surface antigen